MFTPAERTRIRDALITRARSDPGIAGAALAGSAARDAEDPWSDIDLVLQLAPDVAEPEVVEAWTDSIADRYGIADTLDIFAGGVRYRVFLLPSSLQIDVSFWPHDQFRATEPGFRMIFGTANPATQPSPPDVGTVIGMGWLYALHARSALARGRLWQTVLMTDDLRGQLITLICVRRDLNPWHGREVDRLPAADLQILTESRAREVTVEALEASRIYLTARFLAELEQHDQQRADRLRPAFEELIRPVG